MFLVDAFPQLILSILVYVFNFQLRDFTYLKANPLKLWEIVCIYLVVFFFIFKNVIPKFISFGGARRHYNDVKNVKKIGIKTFLTPHYIRLFMHILSGATQVLTSGAYVLAPYYFNTIFSFKFLQGWFIFWDTIHQATGWMMTRNHDGIFAIRAFNLAFMVVKLFFCGQIFQMTSMNEDFITLVGGIFILTSGFAWVRFTCSAISIAQVVFLNIDFTALRENWYSLGLWSGQFLIAWRCQVLGHMHLVFAFSAFYFPIEIWVKKNAHYKMRNLLVTSWVAAFYFVDQHHNETQILMSCLYFVYSYWFGGKYWKRAPIPGVDFNEKETDRKTKKKFNLRRSMSLHRYAFPIITRMFASRSPSLANTSGKPESAKRSLSARRSVSRALSGGISDKRRKRMHNLNQDALAELIQSAMDSDQSPAQLAAEIASRIQNGSLADTPVRRHPMEFAANSPLPEVEDTGINGFHSVRSGSLPSGFAPPCAFMLTPSPSVRNHFHY